MKKYLLSALALATYGGSALAADLPIRKAPPMMAPAPVYSWTGCYVGAGGGYGMWNQDYYLVDDLGDQVSRDITGGGRGWFGTVQVGCDYQFAPRWVLGVFADYDFSGMKGDFALPGYGLVGEEKLRHSWAVGGRIGYEVLPRLLTYVAAGYTEARFKFGPFHEGDLSGPTPVTIDSQTYDGWFIGTGYEYGLGFLPGLFWKTEYRFANYGKEHLTVRVDGDISTGPAVDAEKYVQTVRSELVWRWNWGR